MDGHDEFWGYLKIRELGKCDAMQEFFPGSLGEILYFYGEGTDRRSSGVERGYRPFEKRMSEQHVGVDGNFGSLDVTDQHNEQTGDLLSIQSFEFGILSPWSEEPMGKLHEWPKLHWA